MIFMMFIKKYWPAIIVIIIVASGFWLRVSTFHYPYLRNIDSYVMWRYMSYIVQYGYLPRVDHLMLAPVGLTTGLNVFYQYLGAYSYMFVSMFVSLKLWQYLIYFPAFLASLMAIPMYFIGKYLWSKKAGVLAAFFIVFNVSAVGRSLGGDPDTDAIVMLMPLLVTAVFLFVYKGIEHRSKLKNILYYGLFGFMNALFAYTWTGYWYMFLILYLFLFFKIILRVAYTKSFANIRKLVTMFVVSLIVFWVLVIPVMGFRMIYDPIQQPLQYSGFLGNSIKGEEGIRFPNVYVSVQELQTGGGLKDIAERTAGLSFSSSGLILISPFMLTLYATLYILYLFWKKRIYFDLLLLLFLWFIGPLIAAMVAVRFANLLTPVFSIGSAIFFSLLIDGVYNIKTLHFENQKKYDGGENANKI